MDEFAHVLSWLLVVQHLLQGWCLSILNIVGKLAVSRFAHWHVEGQDAPLRALQAPDSAHAHLLS